MKAFSVSLMGIFGQSSLYLFPAIDIQREHCKFRIFRSRMRIIKLYKLKEITIFKGITNWIETMTFHGMYNMLGAIYLNINNSAKIACHWLSLPCATNRSKHIIAYEPFQIIRCAYMSLVVYDYIFTFVEICIAQLITFCHYYHEL